MQGEPIPEGQFKMPLENFGKRHGLRDRTLSELAAQDGGLEMLAEMSHWLKTLPRWAYVRSALERYLAVPSVAEQLAAAQSKRAKPAKKKVVTQPAQNYAQRERQAEYGLFGD